DLVEDCPHVGFLADLVFQQKEGPGHGAVAKEVQVEQSQVVAAVIVQQETFGAGGAKKTDELSVHGGWQPLPEGVFLFQRPRTFLRPALLVVPSPQGRKRLGRFVITYPSPRY